MLSLPDDAPPVESSRIDRHHVVMRRIAVCAIRSLHAELALYPKPGLVSLKDPGAHTDMDAGTFLRSMTALRRYFADIATAGADGAAFDELRSLGIAAELRMLAATCGVNTHRGAIFTLGLFAAAAGVVLARDREPADAQWVGVIGGWRAALTAFPIDVRTPASHGRIVARDYGTGGARAEAADGFPAVFRVGLPALRRALGRGANVEAAQLHALFALLAHVTDTNLLYRGGRDALAYVRGSAQAFLREGGVFTSGWRERAEALHRHCTIRRFSPGGSADLWSACWFVHQLQQHA
jgi:triphosphoribosyl-dephospho-CoA synthase